MFRNKFFGLPGLNETGDGPNLDNAMLIDEWLCAHDLLPLDENVEAALKALGLYDLYFWEGEDRFPGLMDDLYRELWERARDYWGDEPEAQGAA